VKNPVSGERNPVFIPSDPALVVLAERVASNTTFETLKAGGASRNPRTHTGTVASGDVFIASEDKKRFLAEEFGADAVEMEGAAVAQLCYQQEVPFIVIRSISDNADQNAELDLERFYQAAAENSAALTMALLRELAAKSHKEATRTRKAPGHTSADNAHFVIRVRDEETGRGVPLVEIALPNAVTYWTDSAGVAALNEPSFQGREVFITIRSDGYEFPQETPFGRGRNVTVIPGGIQELRVRRTMIAERLYRLTGEGICQVLGQDTVAAAIYRGRIFWIWGDTIGPAYWNFSVSGATSDLQDDPAAAVNYTYFVNSKGQSKPMLPLPRPGLVWIQDLLPMTDPEGQERLIATYTRQHGLEFPVECGLALFDDKVQEFKPWVLFDCTNGAFFSRPCLRNGYWHLLSEKRLCRITNSWAALQDRCRWEMVDIQLPPNATRPSCVAWNEYRGRWIMLLEDFGDVYYAEARTPEGPYGRAVQIIDHEQYNFYNVDTHTFFNQDGGRVIYLEGTYTDSFTDAPQKTPRYNYNQVMYRLRLDDPRLAEAQE
jgi:hypothetical protein